MGMAVPPPDSTGSKIAGFGKAKADEANVSAWNVMSGEISGDDKFKAALHEIEIVLKDVQKIHQEIEVKEAKLKKLNLEAKTLSKDIKAAEHHPIGAFAHMVFDAVFHGGKFQTLTGMESHLGSIMTQIGKLTKQLGQLEEDIGNDFRKIKKITNSVISNFIANAKTSKPVKDNVWGLIAKAQSEAGSDPLQQYAALMKDLKAERSHLLALTKQLMILKHEAGTLGKDLKKAGKSDGDVIKYYGHEVFDAVFHGDSITTIGSMEVTEQGLLSKITSLEGQVSSTEQGIADHIAALVALAKKILGEE